MSGPPTVRVTDVRCVVPRGSPKIDAPAGTSAPMLRPLYPVPTAGPGPGRRRKSSRGLVMFVVLNRCGSALELPTPRVFQSGSPGTAGKIERLIVIVVVNPGVS